MNGAEVVIEVLKKQGVNRVFGYPGGAIMPVYDALFESGITHVLGRHEQGSGFAALGYAKISGKPSVCIATSGPGATNLITALADAQFDSVPMVVITGQVSTEVIGTDAFQEIDMLGLSLAVTKHSYLVEKPHQLVPILMQAFELANQGRPGPVLIDIPKNIQLADMSAELEQLNFDNGQNIFFKQLDTSHLNAVNDDNIFEAAELLKQSKHPVFYVGGGVSIAAAENPLNEILALTQLPVVTTLKGLGVIQLNYAENLGMLGMHGNPAANHTVQECDLLIAVAARFDDRVTGKLSGFATNAKVIHFDIDLAEVDKIRKADVPLIGELNTSLKAFHEAISNIDFRQFSKWRAHIISMKSDYAWKYNKPGEDIFAPMLLKQLSDKLNKSSIISTDVGQHQMWTAQHMTFSAQTRLLTSGGLGTMGFGLPVAIGAKFAAPDSQVIVVSGDGSFMMNVQELATIKRYSIPIKILLLDNKKLGMVKQWQQIFFEKRYSETDLSDNPNFVLLAKAYDIEARTINHKDQVDEALSIMLKSEKPYLLHVEIDEKENVWPLVPPGATNEQMMEKIYDAYI